MGNAPSCYCGKDVFRVVNSRNIFIPVKIGLVYVLLINHIRGVLDDEKKGVIKFID